MDVTEQDAIIGSLLREHEDNKRQIGCLSTRVRRIMESMEQLVSILDRYKNDHFIDFADSIPNIDIDQLRRDLEEISNRAETCRRIQSDLSLHNITVSINA